MIPLYLERTFALAAISVACVIVISSIRRYTYLITCMHARAYVFMHRT